MRRLVLLGLSLALGAGGCGKSERSGAERGETEEPSVCEPVITETPPCAAPLLLGPHEVSADGALQVLVRDVHVDGMPDLVTNRQLFLARADGSFESHPTVDSDDARLVAVEDLDATGLLDVVSLDQATGEVTVLLANDDRSFSPTATSAGDADLGSVAVADVNDDGVQDLVRLDAEARELRVFPSSGDGRFLDEIAIPTAEEPVALALGDVNGDGFSDALVHHGALDEVAVFFGHGSGGFTETQRFQVKERLMAMVVSELSSDGLPDLLALHSASSDEVQIYLGNGAGGFEPGTFWDVGPVGVPAIAVADVDRNGVLDVVVAIALRNELAVFEGAGGRFRPGPSLFAASNVLGFSVGDIDQDGLADIAVASGERIGLIWGGPTGLPKTSHPLGLFLPGDPGAPFATGVAFADFDEDGLLDALVSSTPDPFDSEIHPGETLLFPGNGDGSFGEPRPVGPGSGPPAAVADFDDDGHADIVLTSEGTHLLLGNGDGSFQSPVRIGAGAPALRVADQNGDGRMDVLTADRSTLTWLLNEGGTFVSVESRAELDGMGPGTLATTDLDCDGNADALVGTFDSLGVALGNDDATFADMATVPLGSIAIENGIDPSFVAVAFGDMNGDSLPDAVVAEQGVLPIEAVGVESQPGHFFVLLGKGDGTFEEPLVTPRVSHPTDLALADVNGDGLLDAAVTDYSDGELILLGRGDGTFEEPIAPYLTGALVVPTRVALPDLDADGRPDLVSLSDHVLFAVLNTSRTSCR